MSVGFLLNFLCFLYRQSWHLWTRQLFSSFQLCIHFIFFSCLIALAKGFTTNLKKKKRIVRGDIPTWFSSLWESFHVLIIMYVSCRFFIDVLYQVEEIPLYSYFTEHFYYEWVLNFVFFSFFSDGIGMIVSFFSLLMWLITWFWMINQPW